MTERSPALLVVDPSAELWERGKPTAAMKEVLDLCAELRTRGHGQATFKVWCERADDMPVGIHRTLQEARIEPTASSRCRERSRALVRIWPELIERCNHDERVSPKLSDWLAGRAAADWSRGLTYYEESTSGNRIAAYALDAHWFRRDHPATRKPCGQTSGWGFAPMQRAAALFPAPIRENALGDLFANHTMVDWPKPLPSPFVLAAEALATGRRFEWREAGQTQGSIGANALHADFLRTFDEALVNGNAAEAIFQFNMHFCRDSRAKAIELHEVGADGKSHRIVCRLPLFAFDTTPEDVAVYLTAIGRVHGRMPLGVASTLSRDDWRWQVDLASLRQASDPVLEIPDFTLRAQTPPKFRIDEQHRLTIEGVRGDLTLPGLWRLRDQPIHAALGELGAERSRPDQIPGAAAVVRFEGVLHRLSRSDVPRGLTLLPDALTIDEMLPRIEAAMKSELDPPPPPKNVAEALAAGLRGVCTPWPHPWHHRPSNDEVWSWSPARCREFLAPTFERVSQAPIREEPPNLLATFLYLIADRRTVCLAWPTEIREVWTFKIRTQDHSWILGSLLVPETPLGELLQSPPLVAGKGEYGGVAFSVGDLAGRIREIR